MFYFLKKLFCKHNETKILKKEICDCFSCDGRREVLTVCKNCTKILETKLEYDLMEI